MQETLAKAISNNVAAEMKRKGASQRELAIALGIAQSQVWHRINGTIEFRPSELEKVAEFLGVPVQQFIPVASAV